MNSSLLRLLSLEHKSRIIVGLMSGTSLDGLDIALCEISGHGANTVLKIKHFTSLPYSATFLSKLRPIFANPLAPLKDVTIANAWMAREHAHMLQASLAKWDLQPADIDLLASHGQTIFHAPKALTPHDGNPKLRASATLQIGDGCHLAYLTNILTISDFRQKHVAAGGEGAPLVPYADFLLFSSARENRVLLNIGGIANYTYLLAGGAFSAVQSADTGPGNTLMDTAIEHAKALQLDNNKSCTYPNIVRHYDESGQFAAKGQVDEALLTAMLNAASALNVHAEQASQSTGQETYNLHFIIGAMKQSDSSALASFPVCEQGLYDLLATLSMFTALTISAAVNSLTLTGDNVEQAVMYISGGGVYNLTLVDNIKGCLPRVIVKTSDDLGISPSAKEAALFAVLANQTVFGDSSLFGDHSCGNDNRAPATCFGKISLP